MLKGFKTFLLRGNVVDLAVAVVIGAAFGTVVAALVKDLLTPLVAAIVGQPDFSAIAFTVNGSQFLIGDFINAVLAFVLVAAAVYFFVVMPMNMLEERRRRGGGDARSHHEDVLGMPKRGTGCGTAVRLLYAAFDNTGRRPAPADAGRRAVGSLARGDHMNILDAIVNAQDGAAVQQLGSQVGLAPTQATAALCALMPADSSGTSRAKAAWRA